MINKNDEKNSLNITKLKNGLQIVTEKIPYTKAVCISFAFKVGSHDEKDYPRGIAHFLEHMMFNATKNRSSQEISEEMDEYGISMNAFTSFEETVYHFKCTYDMWDKGFDVFWDMIQNRLFKEEEIEKEKGVILEEIKMYEDSPSSVVYDLLFKQLNEQRTHRQNVIGTNESVLSITKEDLTRFMHAFYQPNNMTIIATGNIKHEEFVNYVTNQTFVLNGKTSKTQETFTPAAFSNENFTIKKDVKQANLAWGIRVMDHKEDDFEIVKTIAHVLGGGMSSRLFQNIREKKGLAYSINASTYSTDGEGLLMGYVGTDASKIDDVKEAIKNEVFLLRNELVSDRELKKAINKRKSSFILRAEGAEYKNSIIRNALKTNQPIDIDFILKNIEKVTKEDIQRIATTYFTPENWIFVELIPENK